MGLDLAARTANAEELYQQGVVLLGGEERRQGAECILLAARMGEAQAQDHLGNLYEQGFFGEPDFVEAARWYRKAAAQRFTDAEYHLGACYELGQGVEQDWDEAVRLFGLAAAMGHGKAGKELEMLRGFGVESGSEMAVKHKP